MINKGRIMDKEGKFIKKKKRGKWCKNRENKWISREKWIKKGEKRKKREKNEMEDKLREKEGKYMKYKGKMMTKEG